MPKTDPEAQVRAVGMILLLWLHPIIQRPLQMQKYPGHLPSIIFQTRRIPAPEEELPSELSIPEFLPTNRFLALTSITGFHLEELFRKMASTLIPSGLGVPQQMA